LGKDGLEHCFFGLSVISGGDGLSVGEVEGGSNGVREGRGQQITK